MHTSIPFLESTLEYLDAQLEHFSEHAVVVMGEGAGRRRAGFLTWQKQLQEQLADALQLDQLLLRAAKEEQEILIEEENLRLSHDEDLSLLLGYLKAEHERTLELIEEHTRTLAGKPLTTIAVEDEQPDKDSEHERIHY